MKPKLPLWLLSGLLLWAQSDLTEPTRQSPPSKYPVVKIFPLAFADLLQPALQMGLEFPMQQRSSLQVEGGWIFAGPWDANYYQQGFKARLQWRAYFSESSSQKPTYTHTGGYLAGQGGFQYYYQDFSRGNASLSEYQRTILAFSLSFLIGYQARLGERFVMDLFAGIGSRYGRRSGNEPPGWIFIGVGEGPWVGPGLWPVVHLGCSIG